MLPIVLAAALGLLLGLAASRRPAALLMPRLRGLWLLVPILALAVLPFWLDRVAPALIWAQDRRLLLAAITLRQSLLMGLIVLNVLPDHPPVPRWLRQVARRIGQRARSLLHGIWKRLRPKQDGVPSAAVFARPARRVHADRPERPAIRWWHRVPLFGLLAVVVLQAAVLIENNGYMPLTSDYLAHIDNPALVAGIRNGALLLHTITGPDTVLPQLALQYRLPLLERWFPGAFPYYGLADLAGAALLALCLFMQFIGRLPGEAPRRKWRRSRRTGRTAAAEAVPAVAEAAAAKIALTSEIAGSTEPDDVLQVKRIVLE